MVLIWAVFQLVEGIRGSTLAGNEASLVANKIVSDILNAGAEREERVQK